MIKCHVCHTLLHEYEIYGDWYYCEKCDKTYDLEPDDKSEDDEDELDD